jgi:dipeptidyl aminopeptidase/acylaminoacyl peptidase
MKKIFKIWILVILFSLFFLPDASGWQEEEPWTPSVDKVVWSPLGDKIAFIGNLNEGESCSLYIMNMDGTNLTKLVEGVDDLFCFSPDGTKIYYRVTTNEEIPEPPYVIDYSYVYVINIDGSNAQRLRNYPESEASFTVSPDGEYTVIDGVLCTAQGQEIRLLPLLFDPSFSPDGQWLVGGYYENWQQKEWLKNRFINLWLLNLNTLQRQPVTSGPYIDSDAKWSPNGQWIVFLSNRSESVAKVHPSKIWLVRPDGSDLHPLFDYNNLPDVLDFSPNWSPDGNWIIFIRFTSEDCNIWVASVDGSQVYKLTNFSYAALPTEEAQRFYAKFLKEKKSSKGIYSGNVDNSKKVIVGKKMDKRKLVLHESNQETDHLSNWWPDEGTSSKGTAIPLTAGGLTLSAIGYLIWKFLRILA